MRNIKTYILALCAIVSTGAYAQQFNASYFGIKSDGKTLNTGSIQWAIDSISAKGGGTLTFHVGRYLTGSIIMKPNVDIYLREGAVIVGSTNPFDYKYSDGKSAIFMADGLERFSITGKGVIEGQGDAFAVKFENQQAKGHIAAGAEAKPALILLKNCSDVAVGEEVLNLRHPAGEAAVIVENSKNIAVSNLLVDSAADGIKIVNSSNVSVVGGYLGVAGKGVNKVGKCSGISTSKTVAVAKGERNAVIKPTIGKNKEYIASQFGIISDGKAVNTKAIQRAIDYISENGGGTLHFYVGRYITGEIALKSNVTINLHEGAILVGSLNPYDYFEHTPYHGVVRVEDVENVKIIGKGMIDGRGREVAYNLLNQIQLGLVADSQANDRPNANRPSALFVWNAKNLEVRDITLKDAGDWVFRIERSKDVIIDNITIDSKAFWNNDGVDICDCVNLTLTNSFIDCTDDAICLKSHSKDLFNDNIYIHGNTVRSSASGFKFGTVSAGGYQNVRIVNNKVYDTHRSAITIATPDGGFVRNVLVDSLYAYNTGNAIYIRINERNQNRPVGTINGVTISNMYCELTAGKPDAGYEYEGPIEDLPRNLTPCGIQGIPGHMVENVHLENVTIVFPGGANPAYAKRGLTPKELDSISEEPHAYPEFSQFKELPAWGFYMRHAKGITFKNVTIKCLDKDYRAAVVTDDVHDSDLSGIIIEQAGVKNPKIHTYKSTNIKTK